SHPSISGRAISMRIKLGASEHARERPCSPFSAVTTLYPPRCKRLKSISRFISLSSISRIFGIVVIGKADIRAALVLLYSCLRHPLRRTERACLGAQKPILVFRWAGEEAGIVRQEPPVCHDRPVS